MMKKVHEREEEKDLVKLEWRDAIALIMAFLINLLPFFLAIFLAIIVIYIILKLL